MFKRHLFSLFLLPRTYSYSSSSPYSYPHYSHFNITGKYLQDPTVPKYSNLFSDASMDDYFSRVSPSYCQSGGPRRLLIQRELFEVRHPSHSCFIYVMPLFSMISFLWLLCLRRSRLYVNRAGLYTGVIART